LASPYSGDSWQSISSRVNWQSDCE
jgi:hypothetical protein